MNFKKGYLFFVLFILIFLAGFVGADEIKTIIFAEGSPEFGRGLGKKILTLGENGEIVSQELVYRSDKRIVNEISFYNDLGVRSRIEYWFTPLFVETNGYDHESHTWNDNQEMVEYFYIESYAEIHGKTRQILVYEDKKLRSVTTWWNNRLSNRYGIMQRITYNDSGDIIEKSFQFPLSQISQKGETRTEFYENDRLVRIEMTFPEKWAETHGEKQIQIFNKDKGFLEQITIIFPDSISRQKGKRQEIYFDNKHKPVQYECWSRQNLLLARKKIK